MGATIHFFCVWYGLVNEKISERISNGSYANQSTWCSYSRSFTRGKSSIIESLVLMFHFSCTLTNFILQSFDSWFTLNRNLRVGYPDIALIYHKLLMVITVMWQRFPEVSTNMITFVYPKRQFNWAIFFKFWSKWLGQRLLINFVVTFYIQYKLYE